MADRIPLAAILAGGESRRMGREKASLQVGGFTLMERVYRSVSAVSEQVIAVGGRPLLQHLGVPTVSDRYPGANAMGGIATALEYAAETLGPDTVVLCVACDMPFLEPALLLALYRSSGGYDIVVPRTASGYEPLCALYRVPCLPVFTEEIAGANFCIFDVYSRVQVREVAEVTLRRIDPDLLSLLNVNRPQDFETVRRILNGG